MAGTTQLNGGDATLHNNTHDESLALDPELVADVLNADLFVDINEENAEYERYLAGQPETAFNANGLDIPGPALPALSDGPSRANSTIALRTPEPEYNGADRQAGDVHGLNEPHNADADFDLDDFVIPSAYEPAVTVKTEHPVPDPAILHQFHSEPYVSTTGKPPLLTRSSPSTGALLPSPTEPHIGLYRSPSKRGRQDTSNDVASLVKKPSVKRHKQEKGGFPCDRCSEIFDRACDRTKHFERTHKPKDQHRNICPHCHNGTPKTFLYPKDLRRHIKQMHNDEAQSVSPDRKPPNTSPASPTASKPSVLRALSNAVMSLKKLRITATSPQHNLIMVSKDQKSFFEVEVSGLNFDDDLISRILKTLEFDEHFPQESVQAQTYSRQYGRVKLGQKLDAQNILKLVTKNADGQGSLKLLISTTDGYGNSG